MHIAIAGNIGSGKTTLLSLLAGLDEPRNGEILYNNQNIKEFSTTNFISQVIDKYNGNIEIKNKNDLVKPTGCTC